MRRAAAMLAALAFAAGALAPPALADGDPASDILLSQDAFYPYAPNTVSKPLQRALNGMLKQARAKGFGMKVAMIAARGDLGAVPQMLDDPQGYANLLTSEIAFNVHPRVLVVLPTGIGGNNLGDHAGPVLKGLLPDPSQGADGLARVAMQAVGRLTAAEGKPVPVPHVSVAPTRASKSGGGGAPAILVFGLPVLLVLAAAGLAMARGRGREDADESE